MKKTLLAVVAGFVLNLAVIMLILAAVQTQKNTNDENDNPTSVSVWHGLHGSSGRH